MTGCCSMLSTFFLFWIIMCPVISSGQFAQRGGKSTAYSSRGRASHVMRGFESSNQPELLPKRIELYQPCRSSYDCLTYIPHSHCHYYSRMCTCQDYHVPYNNTMCLPASLLGYGCVLDSQCRVKVANSRCIDGLCGCEANHIPLRKDKCLPPAPVGEYCLNNQQCLYHSSYSYCKYIIPRVYGKCVCPLGYAINQDRQCLPHLGSPCEKHDDCEAVTPNSQCRRSGFRATCECRDGYEPSSNFLTCEEKRVEQKIVPNISLGHECTHNIECASRDPNSHCLNGTCECIAPDSSCSATNRGCYKDSFQCRNGFCISYFFVCDKENNCHDNSDEDECIRYNCPKHAFQCDDGHCLPRSSVCNGHWECPDGSDEARCYTGIPCDKNAFRCKNGQCLPAYTFCNAIKDCADGSDELEEVCNFGRNCSIAGEKFGSHLCDNNKCRSSAILCSGIDGCGDNSDETRCEVCYCKKP